MLQPQSILRVVISHGTEALDTTVGEVRGAPGAAMGQTSKTIYVNPR